MADIITIGIAGGTGSGKTTITRTLQDRFSHHVSVIYHDNYYHAHDDMTYEERSRLNYDAPEAFDTQRLIRDLKALRRGEAVSTTAQKKPFISSPPLSLLWKVS